LELDWKIKAPFRHSVAKGANPQNACILQILAIIGNWIGNKISLFFVALLQNIFINYFIPS
jgi:hypothetical protein